MDPRDGTTFLMDAVSALAGDLDIVDFLQTLTEAASTVGDAAAVGIVLADHDDRLRYMAASGPDAALLELVESGLDEGPCPEAFHTDAVVVVDDVDTAVSRWRSFRDVASITGFKSVLALPLRIDDRPIGAIGWFGRSPGRVVDQDDPWPKVFASLAAVGVVQEARVARSGSLLNHVRQALDSRVVVEQAKGAVAATDLIDTDEAFTRLRTYAHRHGRRLEDVAEEVLSAPRHARSWWLEELSEADDERD